MESGTITEWKVKEGEAFAAGDIICLVETDKVRICWYCCCVCFYHSSTIALPTPLPATPPHHAAPHSAQPSPAPPHPNPIPPCSTSPHPPPSFNVLTGFKIPRPPTQPNPTQPPSPHRPHPHPTQLCTGNGRLRGAGRGRTSQNSHPCGFGRRTRRHPYDGAY